MHSVYSYYRPTPSPSLCILHRLKPRSADRWSRMVRAAHPSFTRMVRSPSSFDMFERVVRAPMHLRMVPPVTTAFREEPLETGSLNHRDRVGIVCSAQDFAGCLYSTLWSTRCSWPLNKPTWGRFRLGPTSCKLLGLLPKDRTSHATYEDLCRMSVLLT